MFSLARQILAIILVASTFVGSAGLTLHKMACLDSGRISISLEQDLCCSAHQAHSEGASFNALCCAFNQLAFTVSDFDQQKKIQSLAVITQPQHCTSTAVFNVDVSPEPYEQLIPPLLVGERLSIHCTYII